jgi:aryl sulfotransferase
LALGSITALFQGGRDRFFHKGANERWRGVFREGDLALHDAKVEALFSHACARWVEQGRLEAGDPRSMID